VKYSDLLAEIATLVGPLEMQAAIGATKAQLRSLRDDDVLVPRIAKSKIKSPWRIADGLDLLSELDALALIIGEGMDGWEDIQSASKRKRLRVGDIIEAVRQAELTLGRVNATTGYRFLMVMKSEIDEMAKQVEQIRFHNREASNGIPASAFARSKGMRSEGWFQSLFEAGHVSAEWTHHPVTNALILYVSDEDIAAFNRRFLTLPQMQIEFGLHQNTCAARLRTSRLAPFSPHAGRKVFASATTPDVFGYCGDVVFPALVLGQIASAADAGLLFPAHSTATDRNSIVLESFKASMGRSHNAPTQAFSILHASREETEGRVMPLLWHVSYDIQGRWGDTLVTPMDGSGVYALHGSGAKTAKEELHRWAGTDIGGTSRSVYSGFCQAIASGADGLSGGAPQLASIYPKGPARICGALHNGSLHLHGLPVLETPTLKKITWFDHLFQRIDPVTVQLLP
jgi:hypothetical protein